MTATQLAPRQRLRFTYRHGDALRYISHLDLIRTFERALRRAGLPIAYSQGFNPRPRATWAAPMPLGFTGEGEMADVIMEHPVAPAEFAARLARQLPPGLALLGVEEVPRKAPALPAILRQIRYRVVLPGPVDLQEARAAISRLLAASAIERPRRAKGDKPGRGVYDLRPRIVSLDARELVVTTSVVAEGSPVVTTSVVSQASRRGTTEVVTTEITSETTEVVTTEITSETTGVVTTEITSETTEVVAAGDGIEIEMLLCAGENDTARPEEVLEALGYVNSEALVTRLELIFGEPAAAEDVNP